MAGGTAGTVYKHSSSSEFRNLDLLRAIAVLSVFLGHLLLFLIKLDLLSVSRPEVWDISLNYLGHVGVLFFFVHTALVLMLSLDRTKPVGLVLNFYLRRIFRIYPLCIACIIGVLLLKIPQTPDRTYVPWYGSEILANVLLVQNIFRKPDILTTLWTLPREVQMYVALPFLYLLLKRISSSVAVLLIWLVFFAAVPSTPLLSCFPCFMGGLFAYQLGKERVFRLPSGVWPAAIFGLAAFGLALSVTILPDYRADFVLCMLIGLVIPNVVDLDQSWITKASRSVAKYSYGIYLFHFPVIWFAFIQLKPFPVAVRWATLVLLMVLVPVGAYRWIESPLIERGRRLADLWSATFARYRTEHGRVLQARGSQLAE